MPAKYSAEKNALPTAVNGVPSLPRKNIARPRGVVLQILIALLSPSFGRFCFSDTIRRVTRETSTITFEISVSIKIQLSNSILDGVNRDRFVETW